MGNFTAAVEAAQWAREEFGHADLGHWARTARLVSIGTAAARNPGGKVTEVCRSQAEQQGAYDFLEDPRITPRDVMAAVATACARRACQHPYVYVPIDGSSINLTDRTRRKGLGSVGSRERGARGLKMINAIAVSPDGVPLGLLAQVWWARGPKNKKHHSARKLQDKETRHWLEAVDQTLIAVAEQAEGPLLWYQLDREADAKDTLWHLASTRQLFTVRSAHNRRLKAQGVLPLHLRERLRTSEPTGEYSLEVSAGPKRSARTAKMVVRASSVVLSLGGNRQMAVNVVWATEQGTTPKGEKPLDWCLLTNFPVDTFQAACQVIRGYSQRWRIEDFHRTWKSGACNVEDSQLRERDRVIKWATILAANAMRIESLKPLSRHEPDLPASVELTPYEIQAVILLKREHKKRTEEIPDTMPTISQATIWIAQLGGYTGKSSGGPPGVVTLERGFELVRGAAAALCALGIRQLPRTPRKRRKNGP
jgi:hypothetical protein